MEVLERICEPGDYGDCKVVGTNRNNQIGRYITVPDGETITFDTLDISNVFVPIVKRGNGQLHIRESIRTGFGGDGMNIIGSNVTIEKTYVRDNTPTRPYDMHELLPGESVLQALKRLDLEVYDPKLLKAVEWRGKLVLPSYHVDGIAQIYAVDETGYRIHEDGCISNIKMPFIEAELSGAKTQGIMGSEANRYTRFEIGTEGLFIKLDGYKYSIVFNQLDNSQIGSEKSTNINGKVKIKNVKESRFKTRSNTVEGLRLGQLQMPKGSFGWGHFHGGQERFSEDELRFMSELV